jgi:hypothetical protein
MFCFFRKGIEANKLKMAKESGKGANSYKLVDKPKVSLLKKYVPVPHIHNLAKLFFYLPYQQMYWPVARERILRA